MHEKKHFHLDCDLTSETAYDRKDTIKIMVCIYIFNLLFMKIYDIFKCTLTNNNYINRPM